ncbi:hypothetical protein CRM22_005284 [Opisthorchis felineus]|uniref:Uncharacterized protein n=1 Tax=Opisthorchis felineus TaxID=147828 RepID=A0A4S2LZ07_OPIFE|nr:hypothetical protein CRM22_005284 [Opisthorchis felineus]
MQRRPRRFLCLLLLLTWSLSQGLDDITGEPLIQREDDQPETVRARLETYGRVTKPLFDYYKSRNLLHSFRGRYSNELWPLVHKAFSQYLKPLQYTEYK